MKKKCVHLKIVTEITFGLLFANDLILYKRKKYTRSQHVKFKEVCMETQEECTNAAATAL